MPIYVEKNPFFLHSMEKTNFFLKTKITNLCKKTFCFLKKNVFFEKSLLYLKLFQTKMWRKNCF